MRVRVPDAGAELRDRERLIAKLRVDLRRFQRIPLARREAECADAGEETCRALLREMGVEV